MGQTGLQKQKRSEQGRKFMKSDFSCLGFKLREKTRKTIGEKFMEIRPARMSS